MATYMALVEADEARIQNAQEFATVWGDIQTDLEELDTQLVDAYAILGEHDFLVLFEADGREAAFQTSLAIERYGLDMQTMEIIPVDELGGLVDDF